MKALCNTVNLLAMIMVLLLGAVSVHAHEELHHGVSEHVYAVDLDSEHVDPLADSHPADDRSMHCGAPMLGASTVSMGCVIRVASVVYTGEGVASATDISSRNLRPPRR